MPIDTIYYILMVVVGLYTIWLVLRNVIDKILGYKICAICATVISTWSILLLLKLFGFGISEVIIAILIGQSITGFMYFLEKKSRSTNNQRLLLMKPFVIVFGTLVAYWVLSGVY